MADPLGGILSDLGIAGSGSATNTIVQWGMSLEFIIIAVIIIAVILTIVFWKKWKKWDVLIEVHSKTATVNKKGLPAKAGEDIVFTPAKFIWDKKRGTWGLKLKKYKLTLPPPNYKCRKPMSHKRYKEIMYYWQESPDNFIPFEPETSIDSNKVVLNLLDSEAAFLASKTAEEITQTYEDKNFIQKYGGYIIFAIAVVGTIVLISLLLQKFDVLLQVANRLENVARILRGGA